MTETKPMTTEEALKELHELFPDKWRLTITTTAWINRLDDSDPNPDTVYQDVRISLPDDSGNPEGDYYIRSTSLPGAMAQVRAWKAQEGQR